MAKLLFLHGTRNDFRKFLLIFLIAWSGTYPVWAQKNVEIQGKVIDKRTGDPVIGASLSNKDDNVGTVTDIDGNFKVRVSSLPATLVVNFIGYKTEEIDVYEQSEPLTLALTEDRNLLNTLVVVGYQQTKKGAVTSAVSNIRFSDLANTATPSLTGKLQGEVPGLFISQNSGVPGTSSLVRLRGATSITAKNNPIYIIDDVVINTDNVQQVDLGGQYIDPLASINPDDIESVTVLKDAGATAAYGARGANGVILITTKRGARNQKTKVNFNSEWGWSDSQKLWDLTSGPEHAEIVNEYYKNNGQWDKRPFQQGDGYYGNPEDQPTYDRITPAFHTAFSQKYNLSVSGGDAKTNFFLGGEYTSKEATLKLQDFERYSFRFNLDHNISSQLKIGTSNLVSNTNRTLVRVGDGPSGFFQAALHYPTFYPIYNDNGTYYKAPKVAFDSPAAQIDHYDGKSGGLHNLNNIYAKWSILEDLTFKSTYSIDHNAYSEKFYYNTYLKDGQPNGAARNALYTTNVFTEEQLLNYLKSFDDKHFLSAYLGHAFQKRSNKWTNISASGFPSDDFRAVSSASVTSATGAGSESALLSYFGGANYSYDNRYSLDLTLRADGSSRVGKNNRWGYFPSVGASWNPMNENFFPQTAYLDDFRIKGSFGLTGNDQVDDFASLGLWRGGANYGGESGVAPDQLQNPDLKWETTRQWNVGFFLSLFKQRLDIEFDYYNKYTIDLLLAEAVPDKTGYSSIIKNIGEASNKGIELQLTSTNITKKNFKWKTTLAVSHNKNVVEKLPNREVQVPGNYDMFLHLQEGYPIYSIWVYNYLGVDPETGDAVYEDVTGEGKITADDKKIVADAWPDFEGSLKNTLTYKNWSLDFNFYYKYGNSVFNYTRSFLESGGTRTDTRSIQSSNTNYWKEENKGSYKVNSNGYITEVLPRPKANNSNADGSSNYEQKSTRNVEDGSYIRFQNITLAYTLPKRWISDFKIQKASLYVTANNLYLWTKYTGPDPDANIGDAAATYGLVQGLDFGTPPAPRTVLFGFNVTF